MTAGHKRPGEPGTGFRRGRSGAKGYVPRYRGADGQGRNAAVVHGSGFDSGSYGRGTCADCDSADGGRRAAGATVDAGVCGCTTTTATAAASSTAATAGRGPQAGRRGESGGGAG